MIRYDGRQSVNISLLIDAAWSPLPAWTLYTYAIMY